MSSLLTETRLLSESSKLEADIIASESDLTMLNVQWARETSVDSSYFAFIASEVGTLTLWKEVGLHFTKAFDLEESKVVKKGVIL